jgi:hypothetical protein
MSRRDEVFPEDKVEATNSSWLHRKKVQHDMAMSTGGDAAPRRGKGGDNISWANANFTGLKNEENIHKGFICYK